VFGFALGPALSAVLVGPFGLAAPFVVIAAMTTAVIPVILRVDVAESTTAPQSKLALDLFGNRAFTAAVLLGAAVFLMIGTFDALWVLVLDDMGTTEWISNVGITIFALPFIFLAATGGRLAQRFGPYRFGAIGLLGGALFMFLYGQMPTGGAMLAIGIAHSIIDGLTVSSTGVAVGMVVPHDRQAGGQGVLGAVQVFTGGITAIVAGSLYDTQGRVVAYTTTAIGMALLVVVGYLLAGSARGLRGGTDLTTDPTLAEPRFT
jgi:hypothetical protein